MTVQQLFKFFNIEKHKQQWNEKVLNHLKKTGKFDEYYKIFFGVLGGKSGGYSYFEYALMYLTKEFIKNNLPDDLIKGYYFPITTITKAIVKCDFEFRDIVKVYDYINNDKGFFSYRTNPDYAVLNKLVPSQIIWWVKRNDSQNYSILSDIDSSDLIVLFEDFSNYQLKQLYRIEPSIFETYNIKLYLGKRGVIRFKPIPTKFTVTIKTSDLSDWIDASKYDYRVTRRNKDGHSYTHEVDWLASVYEGGLLDNWDGYYEKDWEYYIDDLDKENEAKALEYVKKKLQGIAEEDELENNNLDELVREYEDEFDDLTQLINSCVSDGRLWDYENHIHEEIKSTLEEVGNVISFNYEEAVVEIDFEDVLKVVNSYDLDNILEVCDAYNDPECVYHELEYYIERPKLSLDDRYDPYCSTEEFNKIFKDRFGELDLD